MDILELIHIYLAMEDTAVTSDGLLVPVPVLHPAIWLARMR